MPDELLLNAHSAVAALELREPKKYEYHFRTVPSKQSTRSVHSSGTSILPRTISPTNGCGVDSFCAMDLGDLHVECAAMIVTSCRRAGGSRCQSILIWDLLRPGGGEQQQSQ